MKRLRYFTVAARQLLCLCLTRKPGLWSFSPTASITILFHRIGLKLQRLLAGRPTEPLPGDMLVLLHRLERVKSERREDVTDRRRDEPEPPRPRA